MPKTNPMVNGDVPYPQYSVTVTAFQDASLAVTKGYIYTKNSSGNLIVPISTTGVADLSRGVFQARDASPSNGTAGVQGVQCLVPKSRIILKAPANLVVGDEVELDSSGSTTTQDTCMQAVQPHTKGYLGRIVEIYTKDSSGNPKQVTAANDLVIIQLGDA